MENEDMVAKGFWSPDVYQPITLTKLPGLSNHYFNKNWPYTHSGGSESKERQKPSG